MIRFGPNPIKAEYEIQQADYVGVHHRTWIQKFDIVNRMHDNGILVLNSPWSTIEEMDQQLPNKVKKLIADKNIQFYNIDANKVAQDVGLGKRINLIMQSVFYKLANVINPTQAIQILKDGIEHTYGEKGPKIVQMNIDAVDQSLDKLTKIDIPSYWKLAGTPAPQELETAAGLEIGITKGKNEAATLLQNFDNELIEKYVTKIMEPMAQLKGNHSHKNTKHKTQHTKKQKTNINSYF